LENLGTKYNFSRVLHLAVPGNRSTVDPFSEVVINTVGLVNVLRCARAWSVHRVVVASSLGTYAPGSAPYKESASATPAAESPTGAIKRLSELTAAFIGASSSFDVVAARMGGIYGPMYHTMTNLASRLVHAAVAGRAPDLSSPRGPFYGDIGADWCYVKDCGKALALLTLADELAHRAYNVASGSPTTYADFAVAVKRAIPTAQTELPSRPESEQMTSIPYADISRITEAVGYRPEYSVDEGIADYIDWLRAGHAE
jgi:UDP-glucose 4-epimerase